jgi:hypothetical protein
MRMKRLREVAKGVLVSLEAHLLVVRTIEKRLLCSGVVLKFPNFLQTAIKA